MSAQANIVAFDGAATPVSHTLVPIGVTAKDGIIESSWREMLASLPIVAAISAVLRQKVLKGNVFQESFSVTVPVMEAVNGANASGYTAAPKVAYLNTVVITGYFHERATPAERKLIRQLAVNIANGVQTSVTPSTSGNVIEAFDSHVYPS